MVDNEIKIEKDIPIPSFESKRKYPFEKMEIGDSFFVNYRDKKQSDSIKNSLYSITARHRPKKFTLRNLKKQSGIRCWRIE